MRACSFKYHQELIIDGWPTTRASVIAHDTIGRVWFPGPQGGTKYGPHHRHHGRAPPPGAAHAEQEQSGPRSGRHVPVQNSKG